MEKIIRPFGIRRNLDYLKENFLIMWKSVIEYKTNFYSTLLIQLSFAFTHLIFFYVIYSNFGSIVSWKLSDFMLFFLVYDTIFVIFGVFVWKESLRLTITRGKINQYLIRPINPFVGYSFSQLSSAGFLMVITNILSFPILFYFFDYNFVNIFFGSLLFLTICYAIWITETFFTSIYFHSFGLAQSFVSLFYNFNETVRSYPYDFFKTLSYSVFLLLFSGFLVSSLFIPFILGYEIINLKLQIQILLITIIILTLLTLISWHYGLKKYEAFG